LLIASTRLALVSSSSDVDASTSLRRASRVARETSAGAATDVPALSADRAGASGRQYTHSASNRTGR